jgi:peptide/nickel transport system substrate-binding protein
VRTPTWIILAALTTACTNGSAPPPTAATQPPPPTSTTAPGSTSVAVPVPTDVEVSPDQTLRVGSVVRPTTLDPANAFTLADWELLSAVSDGLLVKLPGRNEVEPGVAEAMPEVSEDGRTYTFRLRSDVVFGDGTPLAAPDYVDQIRRVMTLGGQASDLVTSFVAGVDAPDESTVVFTLHRDVAFFPLLLSSPPYLPTHPDVYPPDELITFPDGPVYGVGPWYVASHTDAETILDRNPLMERSGDIQRIVIRYFDQVDEAVDAMEAGEVDVLWRGLDSEAARAAESIPGVTVRQVPGATVHFLLVNHLDAPTDDPVFRQAMAELVDREALTEAMSGQAAESLHSPIPSGFPDSVDAFLDVYGEPDDAGAIQLLRDAGYSEEEPVELELAYPPERYGIELVEAMEELERQIEATGMVEVTSTAQPWNTYVGDVVAGTYDLAFLGWLYDFPDPHSYLAPFVTNGGMGGSGDPAALEHPELVELVDEAAAEHSPTRREELYRTIQMLHAEDVVTLPLWIENEPIAYRDEVTGDPTLDHAETLNVGPTMQLDFDLLRLQGPAS